MAPGLCIALCARVHPFHALVPPAVPPGILSPIPPYSSGILASPLAPLPLPPPPLGIGHPLGARAHREDVAAAQKRTRALEIAKPNLKTGAPHPCPARTAAPPFRLTSPPPGIDTPGIPKWRTALVHADCHAPPSGIPSTPLPPSGIPRWRTRSRPTSGGTC